MIRHSGLEPESSPRQLTQAGAIWAASRATFPPSIWRHHGELVLVRLGFDVHPGPFLPAIKKLDALNQGSLRELVSCMPDDWITLSARDFAVRLMVHNLEYLKGLSNEQPNLYLAWQDDVQSRQWFPIGRLDADTEAFPLSIRYTGGAKRAYDEVGFPSSSISLNQRRLSGVGALPALQETSYCTSRPAFADYIRRLDLPEKANPIEILTVNGGFRTTDSFEVFPKLVKRPDGSFGCRFFLHGWRYVSEPAQERLDHLTKGEELHLALELTNPKTEVAVQIQTTDYQMIGWAPRYLVPDLMMAEAQENTKQTWCGLTYTQRHCDSDS